jgi:hypothetical protein
MQGAGFRVQGSGCRVQSSVFRVQGAGFRVRGRYSVVDIPRESMIARGRSRAGSLVSPAAVVTASNLGEFPSYIHAGT